MNLFRLKAIIIASIFISMFSMNSFSQERKLIQISGVIQNDSLSTLPFVTVLVENTGKGTISNFFGYYSLPVHIGDTLKFSFVGCKDFQFIVPDTIKNSNFSFDFVMDMDTILLQEAIVFPWNTYEQFLMAVVEMEIPENDMDRANRNLLRLKEQILNMEYYPVDASLNYKYFMQGHYDRIYTAGQYPVVSLLNPFAWAQFFKALKNGDFKRKD
ncbi:MAG: hypothetical protein HN704_01000 [Bacteroidetes bacterium]|nr:hypothetical protein [Bacteroidota bacterium]MBT6687264.1 hypothetical protein [Bacteroidota bacterium]MBT7142136.1 hypothetical protein [Bacteroidota bacterium]MBT7490161.1 hypothetical protein [Bacteroidota bacterium]